MMHATILLIQKTAAIANINIPNNFKIIILIIIINHIFFKEKYMKLNDLFIIKTYKGEILASQDQQKYINFI